MTQAALHAPAHVPGTTRATLFLLLAPPAIAELLSGSAPPVIYFHPVGIVLLVLLYGGGTLLIRELRVRWALQWPVLLLAVAYGILEEGTAIQSFFNHNHADMAALESFGMALGVQWPWAVMTTFFHATVSTLIPIAIADLLWPAVRNRPLVGARGLGMAIVGLVVVSVGLMAMVSGQQATMAVPYESSAVLVVGSLLVVLALGAAAYLLRGQRLEIQRVPLLPPWLLGVLAFVAQGANIIVINTLAKQGVAAGTAITVQLIGLLLVLSVGLSQLCHRDLSRRHLVALLTGSLAYFILVTPIHELVADANPDPGHGMMLVGLTALGSLIALRRRVLPSTG